MKKSGLVLICVMVCSLLAAAGNRRGMKSGTPSINSGTNCGTSNALPSIGLPIGDFINANSTGYYWSVLMSGHSYSAEAIDSVDLYNGNAFTLGIVETVDCTTPISFSDIPGTDPNITEVTADRISWISTATGPVVITLTNSDGTNGYSYHISLTDTTLHNPRWSTFDNFVTQYGLLNNTNSSISGTLTVTESTGTVHTLAVTIPAGGMVLRTVGPAGDIVMPGNRFGSAMFAFVGPPGAITGDAYFVGPNASVVVPAVFAPRNYQH